METIKLNTRIDEDGVLRVEVPTDLPPGELEVLLVYNRMREDIVEEDWATFVDRMYGALADDPIERPAQLPLEERDEIE